MIDYSHIQAGGAVEWTIAPGCAPNTGKRELVQPLTLTGRIGALDEVVEVRAVMKNKGDEPMPISQNYWVPLALIRRLN